MPLSASAPLTPLELIQEQPEVERLTLPTGTTVFRAGEPVQFIHVIERGWMELSSGPLNRMRFGRGELFFYEDLVEATECHSRDATAVTPVSLFRLSRTNFLALIHRHPTLVLQLLSKQHSVCRQWADARHRLIATQRSRLRVTLAASTELMPLVSSCGASSTTSAATR